ncbi:MAG: hypothetical protein Q7L55_09445, partial [Actinomycetota bacterium]|nr:hypothetical protein [Actinomycetota bacterium]
ASGTMRRMIRYDVSYVYPFAERRTEPLRRSMHGDTDGDGALPDHIGDFRANESFELVKVHSFF